MGGGTTITISASRTRKEAEEIFSKALKEGLGTELKAVFLSFHKEDEDYVVELCEESKDNPYGIEFVYYSIENEFDDEDKKDCSATISETIGTLVMIGKKTSICQICTWQIEETIKQENKLIGVKLNPEEDDPIPNLLVKHGSPIVEWDLTKISEMLG